MTHVSVGQEKSGNVLAGPARTTACLRVNALLIAATRRKLHAVRSFPVCRLIVGQPGP
jgi:hypothetical protein